MPTIHNGKKRVESETTIARGRKKKLDARGICWKPGRDGLLLVNLRKCTFRLVNATISLIGDSSTYLMMIVSIRRSIQRRRDVEAGD
jgi:hypothetical protein